jgi:hypothetical protein
MVRNSEEHRRFAEAAFRWSQDAQGVGDSGHRLIRRSPVMSAVGRVLYRRLMEVAGIGGSVNVPRFVGKNSRGETRTMAGVYAPILAERIGLSVETVEQAWPEVAAWRAPDSTPEAPRGLVAVRVEDDGTATIWVTDDTAWCEVSEDELASPGPIIEQHLRGEP